MHDESLAALAVRLFCGKNGVDTVCLLLFLGDSRFVSWYFRLVMVG